MSLSPVIVRITTANTAGTYTVDWQTLGGCDPGSGTSGRSGEVTLTVAATRTADDTPEPGELTGTPDVDFVLIRPFCTYVWHVSLVEATTDANCIVGPAPFAPDDRYEIQITLDTPATSCAHRSRIVVRLNPAVPVTVDETDHNAILRTRFIAIARRVEDAPTRCSTRTGVSKVDDNDTPADTHRRQRLDRVECCRDDGHRREVPLRRDAARATPAGRNARRPRPHHLRGRRSAGDDRLHRRCGHQDDLPATDRRRRCRQRPCALRTGHDMRRRPTYPSRCVPTAAFNRSRR